MAAAQKKFKTGEEPNLDHALVAKLARRRVPTWRQLKHLPKAFSKRERLALFFLGSVILVASVIWGVGQAVANREAGEGGGEYTEALLGVPRYINPVLAQTDADLDLVKLTFSGLFSWDGNAYAPNLAESYTVSEDKKTYTVRLRDKLRFHDGKPLIADDVIFTIETIKNPGVKSPLAKKFAAVTVEKIDNRTVNFILREPFAPFLSMLAVGILPEHLWADVPPESMALAELNLKPVGSGPFRFYSFLRDKRGTIRSYTLKRNGGFYGDKPRLQKITLKFFSDFESAAAAYKERAVNGISYVPARLISRFDDKKGAIVYRLDLPQYTAVFFNSRANDVWGDKRVRQAATRALDRGALVAAVLDDNAGELNAPITVGFNGGSAEIKTLTYDPNAAMSLLEEAGFKRVSATGTVRAKKNKELKISLTTVDQEENVAAAKQIKTAWETVGFKVDLVTVPAAQIQKDVIRPRNFEALLFGEALDGEPDPYPFWHSSQIQDPGLNIAGFSQRETDNLLEDARRTADPAERAKKLVAFQNILVAEAGALFLWTPKYLYVTSDRLKSVLPPRLVQPADRFVFVNSWVLKSFSK